MCTKFVLAAQPCFLFFIASKSRDLFFVTHCCVFLSVVVDVFVFCSSSSWEEKKVGVFFLSACAEVGERERETINDMKTTELWLGSQQQKINSCTSNNQQFCHCPTSIRPYVGKGCATVSYNTDFNFQDNFLANLPPPLSEWSGGLKYCTILAGVEAPTRNEVKREKWSPATLPPPASVVLRRRFVRGVKRKVSTRHFVTAVRGSKKSQSVFWSLNY